MKYSYPSPSLIDSSLDRIDSIRTALSSKGTSNFSGGYSDLSGKPTLFDGAYNSLTGKPSLFDGTWSSLTGKPSISGTNTGDQDLSGYSLTSHTHTFASLTSKPTTIAGYGISDAFDGTWSSLSGKPTTTSFLSNSTNKNFVTDAHLTLLGNTSGVNTGDQTISDATISTTDITTNNVSTSKHGFAPKGNNSSTSYLNGTGAWSTPAAVTGSYTFLSGDVTNNNASANTIADVTGLSFAVSANVTYRFKFFIVYTSAATTTGSRWSINGPATTFVNYSSTYTLTATTQTLNSGIAAYNSPSGASASSLASNNIAIIEGIIRPSASGTVIARFASEISSSAIVAKAGQSYVEFYAIN